WAGIVAQASVIATYLIGQSVPSLNISYLYYNVIGCAVCVAVAIVMQRFLPRRFLAAKIFTARRLQQEIGGEIVFFLHDSDHDPRETHTTLRDRHAGQPTMLNFAFMNKIQRKWSPQ